MEELFFNKSEDKNAVRGLREHYYQQYINRSGNLNEELTRKLALQIKSLASQGDIQVIILGEASDGIWAHKIFQEVGFVGEPNTLESIGAIIYRSQDGLN